METAKKIRLSARASLIFRAYTVTNVQMDFIAIRFVLVCTEDQRNEECTNICQDVTGCFAMDMVLVLQENVHVIGISKETIVMSSLMEETIQTAYVTSHFSSVGIQKLIIC